MKFKHFKWFYPLLYFWGLMSLGMAFYESLSNFLNLGNKQWVTIALTFGGLVGIFFIPSAELVWKNYFQRKRK